MYKKYGFYSMFSSKLNVFLNYLETVKEWYYQYYM